MAEFSILAGSATAGPSAAVASTAFRQCRVNSAAATHIAAQASPAKHLSWSQSCQLATLPRRALSTGTPDRPSSSRALGVRAQAVALPDQSKEPQLATESSSTEAQAEKVEKAQKVEKAEKAEKAVPQEWGVAGGAGGARGQGSSGAGQEGSQAKEGEDAQKNKKRLSPALKSRRLKDWEKAQDVLRSGRVWTGVVESLNEGGARVRLGSLLGFLPFSHMEARAALPGANKYEKMVGTAVKVQVIEVDPSGRRLVVSERHAARKLRLQALHPGQVWEGTVAALTDYGAFVDLLTPEGKSMGVGGLVHVSELSWDQVISVASVVSVGQRVKAKILKVEKEKGKLALSMKQVQADPLLDTLDALLPSGQQPQAGSDGALAVPLAEELLGAALPGLSDLCALLRSQPGVSEVSLGRQALERRVVSQDLELWLSNAPARDGLFTLVARAGRQVQEVFVKSSLDRVGMKEAVLTVSSTLN